MVELMLFTTSNGDLECEIPGCQIGKAVAGMLALSMPKHGNG